MQRSGIAELPLHGGFAPPWLYRRMVALAEGILAALVEEFGRREFLRRISDPFWFQCLACVLGYDWHSSGTTTVTAAALKEACDRADVGVQAAGGKGRASRRAPKEIVEKGSELGLATETLRRLERASRLAAKVDSAALQDGYDLYHHSVFLTEDGDWAVVQQGMNDASGFARRYHWLGEAVQSFVEVPHSAILGARERTVLDLTATESRGARATSLDLVREGPNHLRSLLVYVPQQAQTTLDRWSHRETPLLRFPNRVDWDAMRRAYEFQPSQYEDLLLVRGMGPATVRALALIADLVYGEPTSWRDPVKYSFALGGKDGVPYPVDRSAMDDCIEILRQGVQTSPSADAEKRAALSRLALVVKERSGDPPITPRSLQGSEPGPSSPRGLRAAGSP